jgi:tetratricopeptide (TPR) repeat protein
MNRSESGRETVAPEIDDATGDRRRLESAGYWPAIAMRLVSEKKYASAVQVCREHLLSGEDILSGRVAYALALYRAGQTEAASEQFHLILSREPNHLVALKYLGDIAYAQGDEWSAMANFGRILEIDPESDGLRCDLPQRGARETTRTITLVRPLEDTDDATKSRPTRVTTKEVAPKRELLYSETIGDLYLAQGHARPAAEVFQWLYDKNPTPGLAEKLAHALEKSPEKEISHVDQTDQ